MTVAPTSIRMRAGAKVLANVFLLPESADQSVTATIRDSAIAAAQVTI